MSTTMIAPSFSPSISPNVRLVTDFMQTVWAGANPGLLEQFVSDGFVEHAYAPNDKTGHANMVKIFSTAFSQATHLIEQSTEQDDMVVIRVRVRALHTGQFRDIAASGNAIDVMQYRTFRIAEGRLAEHWALFDIARLLQQIQPVAVVAGACAIR